ncbi:hypothetical protein [Cupriavidus basilensis]|uniref:hypothetical protein n=1 Tax=Cupriavidus basilensis TaxID=68895 RepID=UPI00284EF3DE|nr:hypothetical protein [Cupriavidus basilensis]MDR3382329.1 hypothetical protein [Cupriavidus basilensis]
MLEAYVIFSAPFVSGTHGAWVASIRSAGYGRMKLRVRSGSRQVSAASSTCISMSKGNRFVPIKKPA